MRKKSLSKIILSYLLAATVFAFFLSGCSLFAKDSASCGHPEAENVQDMPAIIIEDKTETAITENDTESPEPETGEIDTGETVYDADDFFREEEISDEIFDRMKGKSFPDSCTVSREDLRYLRLLYKDINGAVHEGEMVCNKEIAGKLCDIFRHLYDADYPIEKINLIDEYGGDDDASMSDNNTSCFNYRVVAGTGKLSKHAMGLAVDLNPRYNPYIHKIGGETVVDPANGADYADRSGDFTYKIDKDDLAYRLFTDAGFTWGGSWKNTKDYQHFQYGD